MEIVSGTKIGLDVAEYVAIFCRLIVLGEWFLGLFSGRFLLRLNFLVILGLTGGWISEL